MAALCPIPRPYQGDVIRHYKDTQKSFLVHLPTGSGKSVCMEHIVKLCLLENKQCLILIRGISLIHQFSKRLKEREIPHGIMQRSSFDGQNIQIASIDTLHKRQLDYPPADLLVIDEAHLAVSGIWRKVLENYKGVRVVSFSATPYRKEGFRHIAEEVLRPIDYDDLVEKEWLAPPVYYAPKGADLSKARVRNGEFVEADTFKLLNERGIYGRILENYTEHLTDRPTICFAVNIEHSRLITEMFNKEGITAEHLDCDSLLEERDAALGRLKSGETKIICNVGILTTGVDIPVLSGILLVRPTLSKILYIQMLGRGSRIYPGKKDFIVIDLAGNVYKHGFIEEVPECSLDDIPRVVGQFHHRRCPSCTKIVKGRPNVCLKCGFVFERDDTPAAQEEVEIERIDERSVFIEQTIRQISIIGKSRNYNQGWVYFQALERFGAKAIKPFLPFDKKEQIYQIYAEEVTSGN